MNEATINFLLVLVTGRVWGNQGGQPFPWDIWDDAYCLDWIKENLMSTVWPAEYKIVDKSDAYSKYPINPMNRGVQC